MNIESNPPRESVGHFPAAVTISDTQTLYWSVRRELWENRSIYIAPLITAIGTGVGEARQRTVGSDHRARGQQRRQRPLDPVIAPHRSPINQIER